MTITLIVPLVVALAGLLAYVLAVNPKAAEIGRIAYFAGLLVTLLYFAGHTLRG